MLSSICVFIVVLLRDFDGSLDSPSKVTSSSVPDLTLNCWVHGHDIGRIFTVEISSTKTVSALRVAIKDMKPVDFHDVDADTLVLYKACLPCDEDLP